MKVIQLNYSDISGGAARAAYRIHHALRDNGVDSQMWVNSAKAGDWTVQAPKGKIDKVLAKLRPSIGALPTKLLRTANPIIHSPSWLPSNWVQKINISDADVVHLHWVAGEMLSIQDIGAIKKSVVWTLHDMWAFCGAEHYTEDSRWIEGYRSNNRPAYESKFDLNRWTWQRKRNHWKSPIHIVAPSQWLAECARQSALMRDWSVTVIPNAIDTVLWQPVDKNIARQLMHLPLDVPMLVFGAMGGANDHRKGFDLLKSALDHLRGQMPGMELIVFGSLPPRTSGDLGFSVHYTGHLHDDITLRLLYSAADAIVVPSRLEVFGQTASEAHSCGTPVIAFNIGGLPDIVDHKVTGYLAEPFDVEELAKGIKWVLGDENRHKELCCAARGKAMRCFDYSVVAQQYKKIYEYAISVNKDGLPVVSGKK